MLKKLLLVASIIYTLALLTVCLINLNNAPKIEISHGDKIFHFLAYFIFTWLWFNTFLYRFHFKKNKSILLSILVSVTFGIVIEVLQHLITTSRGFDILDIFANILGVIISAFLINNYIKIDVKKY